jgi:hypothetical protein
MSETAIQTAISIAVGSYKAACRLLTAEERAILRSVLVAAIAKDSAAAIKTLDDLTEERAA